MGEFHDKDGVTDLTTRQEYVAGTIEGVRTDLEHVQRCTCPADQTEKIAHLLFSLAAELTEAASALRDQS
jgi:hypothetical protein